MMAGDNATAEQIEQVRIKLGLDQPLLQSFWQWFTHLLHGDLGISLYSNTPVTELIAQRMEPTLMLALSATIFSVLFAVPLGIISATKRQTFIDRFTMIFVVLGFSLPVFLVGYGLIRVFAIDLRWLPVQGYVSVFSDLGSAVRHLVLPAITIGLVYAALVARMTRSTMIEVLRQDYIRTAEAKGLPATIIMGVHALKNAAPPIVTTIGLGVAMLLGGVVVTESVFAIPGLGRLTVDAVLRRDYPVIQGLMLLFSAVYFLVNLIVDLSLIVIDPQARV